MLVQRTEQHIIDRQSKWYKMLEELCHKAKNTYNQGNYLIRQEFIKSGKWLRSGEVDKLIKYGNDNENYYSWIANANQQVLRRLDKNWKSFFASIKDWKKNPGKYKGMPKLPKYLKKDGLTEFGLTTVQCKLKNDNLIHFHQAMNGLTLQPQFIYDKRFVRFNHCRIVPKNDRIIVELIYTVSIPDFVKENGIIGSIDLGLDNFVTFVDNLGNAPIIINGKGLKSCNQYYNKLIAQTKSELDKNGNSNKYSHLLYSITNKRNDKVKHFMNKAAKYIIENCLDLGIKTIVIGKNNSQKQNNKLKNFIQIPYNLFIQKLTYKCQEVGIELILTEENYTSGTSFLDDELPTKENYDISRRIKRGLFKSNDGKLINADVNAAYQIMKKVFSDAVKPGDIGLVMNPVQVNLEF